MGNKQASQPIQSEQIFHYRRFTSKQYDFICQDGQSKLKDDISSTCIQAFQCVQMISSQSRNFQIQKQQKGVIVSKYYEKFSDLQIYLSNLIKISKLVQIPLYDEIKFNSTQPYASHITIHTNISKFNIIDYNFSKTCLCISKKLDLLQFVTNFLANISNIYICPQFIAEGSNGFHLLNFSVDKSLTPQKIFLAFLRWTFGECTNFQICLTLQDTPSNLPIYLQQVYNLIYHQKVLKISQIHSQLKYIKDKMNFLLNKTDSFYACQFFNKIQKYLTKFQWIFMKSKHQIFFYHIKDLHSFNGKIIRKKKKKDVEQIHLTFDPEELQILYIPQNAKYIVKASQFEFQGCSSISDIQIKYKLPIKFKKCITVRARNGDLLLLDQYLYRYLPLTNKLIQQTKRISDYIFLSSTRQSTALIIKFSIDIFRNGIRVFYKNQDVILAHTGEEKLLSQISSIRIDIRHVIFCIQVYKGVFLMMASKNIWILDLNFECFFSFATPSQIKRLTSFSHHNNAQPQSKTSDHIFTILNQPFKVDLSFQNDGNNAAIKDNFLHMIGTIEGFPYYLKYNIIHRIGALKLQGYHPLYVQTPFHNIKLTSEKVQTQRYHFNFHQQNSSTYKYHNWIFKGKLLVKVFDFRIRIEKSNYQVELQIQKIQYSLKQHIEKLNKNLRKFEKVQIFLFLYKIYQIYEYIFNNSINHRNISISHLCFTSQKQLKLHGWSQPPRNWHVSDYKDFLLVLLNLITYSTYQKLTDKIISKHESQLAQYPIISDKINQAFKQNKTIEKRTQIQKNLQVLKSYLQKQLSSIFQKVKTNNFIFSFEYKTPRMTVLNIQTQKMKKITIIPEQTIAQQFIFNQTDKYCWNQDTKKLYIITQSHQFFQLKINTDNMSEQKLVLEDYEYLPQNISACGLSFIKADSLYSFGGIKKQVDGRTTYNKKIYKFNWKSLTWQCICQMPQPRINPQVVVSRCKTFAYLIGGLTQHQCPYLKILKFDSQTNTCSLLVDKCSPNINWQVNFQHPLKIFHLSEELCVFMLWYIEDGDYVVRYVSFTSIGFNVEIRVKNYLSQNSIAKESVSLDDNVIHILRPYGKYTKLIIHNMENGHLKNQTIYAI